MHIELYSDGLSSGQLHENPSTHAIFIKPSHKPLSTSRNGGAHSKTSEFTQRVVISQSLFPG